MIDVRFILLGIILGVFCMAGYVIVALVIHKLRLQDLSLLRDGMPLFLSSFGIAVGVRACTKTLSPAVLQLLGGESIYFFIGGVAFILASIEVIIRIFCGLQNDTARSQ